MNGVGLVTDPWQAMDDWCRKQSLEARDKFSVWYLENGLPLTHPDMRLLLGHSQALGRMRSFIHGARNCDSGRLPKGEDTGMVAECEASQSGRSDSEGIAHPSSGAPS